MDEVRIEKGAMRVGPTYTDAQFEALMKDRQAARNQKLGAVVMLTVVGIIGAVIVIVALAMNGVFGG